MEFIRYGKTKRYSPDKNQITITEKIDGTNAQIWIPEEGVLIAGSRNGVITPQDDHYGFAKWVDGNKQELLKLGKGRHYGEWWGEGIQKNRYGVKGKHFSLFNTFRPKDTLPNCVSQVPILYRGIYSDLGISYCYNTLQQVGSVLGGMNPEGIIIYFHLLREPMKMTFDFKEGKWGDK